MSRILFLMAFICILLSFLLPSFVFSQEYQEITPDQYVTLPNDLYYKSGYRVQWWYFTGHLFDRENREFGYQLTFFTVDVQNRNYSSRFGINTIYISHIAVSDSPDISGQDKEHIPAYYTRLPAGQFQHIRYSCGHIYHVRSSGRLDQNAI